MPRAKDSAEDTTVEQAPVEAPAVEVAVEPTLAAESAPSLGQVEADTYARLNALPESEE